MNATTATPAGGKPLSPSRKKSVRVNAAAGAGCRWAGISRRICASLFEEPVLGLLQGLEQSGVGRPRGSKKRIEPRLGGVLRAEPRIAARVFGGIAGDRLVDARALFMRERRGSIAGPRATLEKVPERAMDAIERCRGSLAGFARLPVQLAKLAFQTLHAASLPGALQRNHVFRGEHGSPRRGGNDGPPEPFQGVARGNFEPRGSVLDAGPRRQGSPLQPAKCGPPRPPFAARVSPSDCDKASSLVSTAAIVSRPGIAAASFSSCAFISASLALIPAISRPSSFRDRSRRSSANLCSNQSGPLGYGSFCAGACGWASSSSSFLSGRGPLSFEG